MLVFDYTDRTPHRRGDRELHHHRCRRWPRRSSWCAGAYPGFDLESYRAGHLTPVYFGSASTISASRELLDALAAWRRRRGRSRPSRAPIEPTEPKVAGFVFKVQANMDPNHRDRVAFLRLCCGKFRRGMKLTQMGTGKVLSVNSPILFFAREREIVDEAWPGDIIGIPNHGVLRVGDTLTEGETSSSPASPISRRKSCAACGWRIR